MARLGYRWESFANALRREPARAAAIETELARRDQRDYAWSGCVAEGLYAQQLKPWLRTFEREQFLFLLTEDLWHEPARVVRSAIEFLAVPTDVTIDVSQRHNTQLMRNAVSTTASRPRPEVFVHRFRHPLRTLSRALAKYRFGPAKLADANMSPSERQAPG